MRSWNETRGLKRVFLIVAAFLAGYAPPLAVFAAPAETRVKESPDLGREGGNREVRQTIAKSANGTKQSREWTLVDGTTRITGAFVTSENGIVKILNADGKDVDLKFDRLAVSDQIFILKTGQPRFDVSAKLLVGKVVGVTDGDTVTVLDFDKVTSKIRLDGIDAPESSQDFGTQAKKALSEKVFGKYARVEWKEHDKYKRIIGHIYVDAHDVNKEIVEDGFAWHYKQYSRDQNLAAAEVRAREAKRGLWSMSKPVPPWDFRHKPAPNSTDKPSIESTESGQQGKALEVTVYVTLTGTKYHSDGCRHLSKSKIPIELSRAKEKYGPCSVCKPAK